MFIVYIISQFVSDLFNLLWWTTLTDSLTSDNFFFHQTKLQKIEKIEKLNKRRKRLEWCHIIAFLMNFHESQPVEIGSFCFWYLFSVLVC